jgi:hypothetical protein
MVDTASQTSSLSSDAFLRAALKLDAVVTGANGVAYLALAGPLADLFEVPAGFLRALGAFLAVFAVAVWLAGARGRIAPAAVRAIVAANVAWVLASVVALLAAWHDPSTVGAVWTALQAAVVAAFAALQAFGLRQAR